MLVLTPSGWAFKGLLLAETRSGPSHPDLDQSGVETSTRGSPFQSVRADTIGPHREEAAGHGRVVRRPRLAPGVASAPRAARQERNGQAGRQRLQSRVPRARDAGDVIRRARNAAWRSCSGLRLVLPPELLGNRLISTCAFFAAGKRTSQGLYGVLPFCLYPSLIEQQYGWNCVGVEWPPSHCAGRRLQTLRCRSQTVKLSSEVNTSVLKPLEPNSSGSRGSMQGTPVQVPDHGKEPSVLASQIFPFHVLI